MENNDLIIYKNSEGNIIVDAIFKDETLWLTQKGMSKVFDCSTDNISLHLKNIFKDNELDENSVVEDSSVTTSDGKNYKTKIYNLDAIIAVGYRVNSKKATEFRIWATKILKDYILKELDLSMGIDVYEMYQDIPAKESGSTNECFGLSYEEFPKYLEKEINRKNNKVTYDDTPTTTYIMYVDNKPVGLICLRTKINDNWMKWSGNFYYRVRLSERKKGYGTKMLELALAEFKKLGFKEVYGQSSAGNIGSAKVIENNGGVLLEEIDGTRYYKIEI